MEIKSVADIAECLKKKGEKLHSLSDAHIRNIEQFYGVSLPGVYRQFLSLMGNGAGRYMLGSAVFYDHILLLGEWGKELIEENELSAAPPDAFFFWMHQGYQAAYFKLSDGDDPPVYFFSEGEAMIDFVKESSLTNFLIDQLFMSYSDLPYSR